MVCQDANGRNERVVQRVADLYPDFGGAERRLFENELDASRLGRTANVLKNRIAGKGAAIVNGVVLPFDVLDLNYLHNC